jgi:hypothetical protein
MVDKSRIVDGLCEIKDFITNANEERVVTDNDIAHFEEVIEAAKDYLLED